MTRDPPSLLRDPTDDDLVALARTARARAIVTGDKDLLEHPGLHPPALTVRAACELLGLDRLAIAVGGQVPEVTIELLRCQLALAVAGEDRRDAEIGTQHEPTVRALFDDVVT